MTALLQQVIDRVETLPESEQDFAAGVLVEALESERKWDELFAKTTDSQWQAMMSEVEADIKAGRVHPVEALDEVTPD